MNTPNLDQLRPTLAAMPAVDVQAPGGMPIATFMSEAETLGLLVAKPEVRQRLEHVGMTAERLDIYPTAVGAAVEAQSVWLQFRDRKHDTEFKEATVESEELLSKMVDASRWNLRRNGAVQSALDLIHRGDGVPDLVQDLHDVAGLVENNKTSFAADNSFDADQAVDRARELRRKLLGEAASHHHAFGKNEAKEMRDRAYTFLNDLVGEVRDSGRYAYSDDEAMTTRFTSGYYRRRRNPSPPDAPAPVIEAGEDDVVTPVSAE